jgi:FkbM family methyltransferase
MMTSLKRAVRKLVRRFGYEVVRTAALEDHAFARHLERMFHELNIQCVLDVGANRGQYHQFLRDRVGFGGLIISFEPLARNVALLQELAKNDPRWVIQGYALGSEDARMDINVMKPDFLSSFRSPHDSMIPMYTQLEVFDHFENVQVHKLDSVVRELRRQHALDNIYLKLDTQGFDLEVIRGAPSTLPTVRALQTELSVRPIYKNAPSYREMLDAMTERDFSITAMFPVGRDERMRVIEFDCVMINGAA